MKSARLITLVAVLLFSAQVKADYSSPNASGEGLQTKVSQAINQVLSLLQSSTADASIRRNVRLLDIVLKSNRLTLNFSPELLDYRIGSLEFEEILRQIHFAANEALKSDFRDIDFVILIDGVLLNELFKEVESPVESQSFVPPARTGDFAPQSISGRRIAISPGHGYYLTGSTWGLQRSYWWGIVEDFVNPDIAIYLNSALVAAGADVRSTRNLNKSAGNGESGYPKWQEAARYHLKAIGVDSTVWNEAGYTHLEQDIRCRPRYANSVGAEILVSIHNNGSAATGTETWYDTANGYQVESKRLADILHGRIVNAIRSGYNSSWTDRGVKGSNGGYGENRIATRPSVMLEIAFLDKQTPDNAALQNEIFKSLVATAIKDGILEYYGDSAIPDLTIVEPVVVSPESVAPGGSIRVDWTEKNKGTGASSPAHNTKIFLSNSDYGTTYEIAYYGPMDTLGVGATQSYYSDPAIVVPTSVPAGDYYVTAFIDCDSQVSEENENNNIGSSSPNMVTIGTPTDTTPPTIGAFNVSPSSATLGQAFTISYTVSDSGGSGLKQVVLRRTSGDGTENDPGWQDIQTATVSGNGPVSSSFSDTPSSVGTYWYGMAAFDNANNSIDERSAGLGPLQRTVTQVTTPAITSPTPSSTLTSSSATFQWSSGSGVSEYFLYVGSSLGANDIYGQSEGLNLSQAVAGIPTDGSMLYVRLWWDTSAGWQYIDYTYTTMLEGDLDGDHAVNFTDYAIFAGNWMDDTCDAPNWCDGTDFDHSGSIDILDLETFAAYWLEGT